MHNIEHMGPMERHRYITSNTMVCPRCKKEKKLSSFWRVGDITLMDVCKPCDKKILEMEAIKIALSVVNR
jgi:Zn ribbon nucleic-acid-binding protein